MQISSDVMGATSATQAVARYQEIRHRLPAAQFPEMSIYKQNLSELCDEIDCFVLDGYGVLNVGDHTVPGATDRVKQLQSLGKQVRVLTNGASLPVSNTHHKYLQWGIEFQPFEVISSRDALAVAMSNETNQRWGFAARAISDLDQLVPDWILLDEEAATYETCDGFVLLGTGEWSLSKQQLLLAELKRRPRRLLVGNPDLVAPHPGSLSQEPGWFAHQLADATGVEPEFFGKPFDNAFELVRQTIDGIEPHRIAMVGDTLHTDILGGAQTGWRTVLVTDHGLLKGLDVEQAILASGIRPDFIVPTT